MDLQTLMHVETGRHGVVSRRTFLQSVFAGAVGLGVLGWKEAVALQAAELRKNGMACVLLFMRGGPSQLETFDPKPGTDNGGPTQSVSTAVPGIQIAEPWSNVAKAMKDITIIRSMSNKEGEHQRAAYQLHTGYVPSGTVKYPSLGSVVAAEIGKEDFDLPNFVHVGGRLASVGSGFLGMRVAPFVVTNPNQMPNNLELPSGVPALRYTRRLDLMKNLEEDFAQSGGRPRVQNHAALYNSAAQMVLSPHVKAFNLSEENSKTRERYGNSAFGQGCLLARRLVERGVTFVEVEMSGWDTHQDNFNRTKSLSQTADAAFAALITDLKERGRLDKTLIIWMGEFGRTPRINPRTGRDHFPRAFSVALAGGGVRGGQVIGRTNDTGTDVVERRVSIPDLFCSYYKALHINPRKEFMSGLGRPIKIVDGGKPIDELFG